jgi:hypothetical protein
MKGKKETIEVTPTEVIDELKRSIEMFTESYKEHLGGNRWEVRDPAVKRSIECLRSAAAYVIAYPRLTTEQIGARLDAVLSAISMNKHFQDEAAKKKNRSQVRVHKARGHTLMEMMNELVKMPSYVPGCSEKARDAATALRKTA